MREKTDNYNEVKDAVEYSNLTGQRSLIFENPMPKIEEKAQVVSLVYKRFR